MAKDKVTIINKAGFPMSVSRKMAEYGGLKEKPRVLAKPPELMEVIKPKIEPLPEPVKVEVVKFEPETIQPIVAEVEVIEPLPVKKPVKRKR